MAKKTTTFLLLNVFLAALSTLTMAAVSPAVFVFGDSLVDVGNNNFLPSDAPKVNFPPWGIDYPGRTPTGRCTNGFNYADYIGMHYFGSSIEDFEQVAANLTERLGKQSVALFLEKSLFNLIIGSNDIYTLYSLLSPGNSTQKDETVVLILDKFKHQIEVSSHPLALSILYILVLQAKALLKDLSLSLKGFQYSFGDLYEMFTHILSDPQEYGFKEIKAGCCGGGRLNAEYNCLPNTTYCSNRSQYAFWDRSHPTQALHKTMAQLALYGQPLFANPVNIHQLMKS
ncbi:hypothetical protein BHM03_00062765 [Ensete ventricosum]|nr:hypothetical protein BHM03_00062765 [Ensete ventricosum]